MVLLRLPQQNGDRGVSLMRTGPLPLLAQRLGWMALIWLFSVVALGLVAGAIRWCLHA
ncbi:DUF2474 family protein [Sphingomonas sp. CJ20]